MKNTLKKIILGTTILVMPLLQGCSRLDVDEHDIKFRYRNKKTESTTTYNPSPSNNSNNIFTQKYLFPNGFSRNEKPGAPPSEHDKMRRRQTLPTSRPH